MTDTDCKVCQQPTGEAHAPWCACRTVYAEPVATAKATMSDSAEAALNDIANGLCFRCQHYSGETPCPFDCPFVKNFATLRNHITTLKEQVAALTQEKDELHGLLIAHIEALDEHREQVAALTACLDGFAALDTITRALRGEE